MKTRSNASLRSTVALAALLVLAATASGCGIGLPTQPDIGSDVSNGRIAGAARATESGSPQEIVISDLPSAGGTGSGSVEPLPEPELPVPTATTHNNGRGHAWAKGHAKKSLRGS